MAYRRLILRFLLIVVFFFLNSDEDLPVKPKKEWVHMNVLEPEKLEWMKDLPAPRKQGTKKVGWQFKSKEK